MLPQDVAEIKGSIKGMLQEMRSMRSVPRLSESERCAPLAMLKGVGAAEQARGPRLMSPSDKHAYALSRLASERSGCSFGPGFTATSAPHADEG